MELKKLDRAFKLKAAEGDSGLIEGYGSFFGNVDSWGDVVMPGAFGETLAEHKAKGTLPKMLWQHDTTQPIGVWEEIVEDGTGLRVRGRLLLEVPKAMEAYQLLKAGAIDGLSIGYRVTDGGLNEATRAYELRSVDLLEISLVTFPANEEARVLGVKASRPATVREFEEMLRKHGFSRSEAEQIARHGFSARDASDEAEAKSRDEMLALLKATAALMRGETSHTRS